MSLIKKRENVMEMVENKSRDLHCHRVVDFEQHVIELADLGEADLQKEVQKISF